MVFCGRMSFCQISCLQQRGNPREVGGMALKRLERATVGKRQSVFLHIQAEDVEASVPLGVLRLFTLSVAHTWRIHRPTDH